MYSIASDLVAEARPPFVSTTRTETPPVMMAIRWPAPVMVWVRSWLSAGRWGGG